MEVLSGADGVAQSIVGKLGQLLAEELRQIRGVSDKVVYLRDELATMNALLRMHSEVDEGSVSHLIREWMKQVRELAYDAEDCIDIFKLRINGVPPSDRALLSRAKHKYRTLLLRRNLAADIQALHDRTVTVSERRARYGVDSKALAPSASFAPVSAASLSAHAVRPANDPDQFVGIQDQVETLAEKLKAVNDNKLKVFSIVGFGGLGKTTLAVEVCRRLEAEFERQANVSVSQAFDGTKDLKGLLKRMHHQLVKAKTSNEKGINEEENVGDIDNMDVDKLADKLKERLAHKRYLIVIDDVWTIAAWDAIRCRLPENDCGSRIMVTTRIESVAKACSPASAWEYYVYPIKPLEPEYSKKLFVNRVFGPKDACPEKFEATMDVILEKCGGLPLAIVSIASLLASCKSASSIDMWNRICKSIGSQMESNPTLEGMRQIITLSYNHLPHHLKGCMMYLSIFPEDYVIDKNRLLYRWIAEGLVAEKRGLTLIEVAEAYFDELMSRNMIQPANISYDGRAEACRVHDMMLEVTVSKSLEANFVTLVGAQFGGTSYDKLRRISIHGDGRSPSVQQGPPNHYPSEKTAEKRRTRRGGEAMNLQHVRSLSTFQPEGHKLLGELDKFPLLRVLDLEDCKAVEDEHMKHVCQLFLLRFLSLKGTDITKMPSEIGRLEHLQTLNLLDTCLKELPESVINLEKLEFLYFSNKYHWDAVWTLPRGIKRMKALGVVSKSGLADDAQSAQIAQEIGELAQLREFTIILFTSDESVLGELAHAMGRTYSLRWLHVVEHTDDRTKKLKLLLEQIPSPPLLLRYIRIAGVIDELPDWIKSLTHLIQINLSATELRSDQLLDVLCKLPSLMDILLWRNSYIDSELVARADYRFPMLKNLSVVSDYDEHKIIQFEAGSMETLETLEYRFDNRDKKLIGIEHLKSLKEVKLIGSRNNPALIRTVEQLTAESNRREKSKQFKVAVKMD